MEQNVDEVARSVCDADPRSIDERRARRDGRQSQRHRLRVRMRQSPTAPAAPPGDAPAKNAVVYVVADEKSVDAAATPPAAGEAAPAEAEPGKPRRPTRAGAVFGAAGVRVRRRDPAHRLAGRHPGAGAHPRGPPPRRRHPAEPRYTPSRATADFVRCRDLTCRFPGCDKPAQFCDIDHTVAYPVGPTHPSNLKCLCRFHHLLKTFWNGATGWRDRQLPDGTVMWTSPTGHTYTTYPGSKHLFPTTVRTHRHPVERRPTDRRIDRRPRRDDAQTPTHPRPQHSQSHRRRTQTQQRLRRRPHRRTKQTTTLLAEPKEGLHEREQRRDG